MLACGSPPMLFILIFPKTAAKKQQTTKTKKLISVKIEIFLAKIRYYGRK